MLQLLAGGDEMAFTELYLNIRRSIHDRRYGRSSAGSVLYALGKAVVAACRRGASIGGWLFMVSYHRTVDLLRRQLRNKQHLQAFTAAAEISEQELAVASEDPEVLYTLLEKAIGQLSPQEKRVFELCKLEGKTYENAAAELGISKYTAGEYLKDAMSTIRKYVSQRQHPASAALSAVVLTAFLS